MKGGNFELMFDGTSPVNDRRKTINLFLCVIVAFMFLLILSFCLYTEIWDAKEQANSR